MAQVCPGDSLYEVEPSKVPPNAVTDLFREMVGKVVPQQLPHVGEWLRERLADDHLVDVPIGHAVAPPEEREDAVAILDKLLAVDSRQMLCHGDAYPGNVLVGPGDRLLLVDPRGVSGETAYDIAVFALKASWNVAERAAVLAKQIAEQVGVDAQRARSWVFVARAARV
jgi:streptomycin 6-kinase